MGATTCSTMPLTLSNDSRDSTRPVKAASTSGAVITKGPTLPQASRMRSILPASVNWTRAAILATAQA